MSRPGGPNHQQQPSSFQYGLETNQIVQNQPDLTSQGPVEAAAHISPTRAASLNLQSVTGGRSPSKARGHHRKTSSITSMGMVEKSRALGHRRRRSVKFTPEQDTMIVSLRKQGTTWVEIAKLVGLDSESSARNRHNVVVKQQEEERQAAASASTVNTTGNSTPLSSSSLSSSISGNPLASPTHLARGGGISYINASHYQPISWNDDDIECLRALLEAGERAKWKFIAAELTKQRNKRIPAVACQKKFKDMFGVAESSSILGSSLCYIVPPDGWGCLNDFKKPGISSTIPTVYETP